MSQSAPIRHTDAVICDGRLHNLRYELSPALNNTTVFNDFSADRLIGGLGSDWFLFVGFDEVMDPEQNEEALGFRLTPRRN